MIISLVACDDFVFSGGSETTDYETEPLKKKPRPSEDDWEDDFDDEDFDDEDFDDDFKTTEAETDIPTESST